MSKNYKPKMWSEMANKSKEEAWLDEQDRKEKIRLELLELQKADADRLKTIIDAMHSLEVLIGSVEMHSGKGKKAKGWIQERFVKAGFNSEIMYHKLKNQE